MKHLNLISYFGGKYPHLTWLIDKFPKGNFHFIDLMCGSANVALNVDYPLITINDLNDEVVNLFNCLRDHEEELMRAIYFTPFSRSELNKIVSDNRKKLQFAPLERARRYFVKSQLGYGANGSQNDHFGTGMEYSIQHSAFYRVDNWNFKLHKLPEIAAKLRGMQIENRDALQLFDKVNKVGNIIYIDPPYLMSTRKSKKRYMNEVDDEFHHQLAEKIKAAKAFVAVSGYESELYDSLFAGMHRTVDKYKSATVKKCVRREILWTNYDPAKFNQTNNQLKAAI